MNVTESVNDTELLNFKAYVLMLRIAVPLFYYCSALDTKILKIACTLSLFYFNIYRKKSQFVIFNYYI